ncbi:hypothetical protein M406DRAFT_75069 [Cryphonectria parasitica EP155]|uniref:Uncharacterized protein n=1 Tax=Cryphonectria parasitica (strain ATCC 38755 / EP155) TaxID=660469 RepID=A0A9P5CN73_CRYP1|nr:uncharacterized protein M406DRAFT_75069 [Cryphonectria parasitica EP155]KAF3763836.1 hypothetical protein M406DRAFT_75069 [Cryphonectria parasitica EP155]
MQRGRGSREEGGGGRRKRSRHHKAGQVVQSHSAVRLSLAHLGRGYTDVPLLSRRRAALYSWTSGIDSEYAVEGSRTRTICLDGGACDGLQLGTCRSFTAGGALRWVTILLSHDTLRCSGTLPTLMFSTPKSRCWFRWPDKKSWAVAGGAQQKPARGQRNLADIKQRPQQHSTLLRFYPALDLLILGPGASSTSETQLKLRGALPAVPRHTFGLRVFNDGQARQ